MEARLRTYTGKVINVLDPEPEDIDIETIAHGLSLLCRFGGHCNEFYSVADHSLRCSDKAPDELKLEALIHDASEAYLVDMPRPIKEVFSQYRKIEKNLESIIAKRFGTNFPMHPIIKEIDNKMLNTEKRDLMAPDIIEKEKDWPWGTLLDPYEEKIIPRSNPKEVEREFLSRFYELTV